MKLSDVTITVDGGDEQYVAKFDVSYDTLREGDQIAALKEEADFLLRRLVARRLGFAVEDTGP